MARLTDRGVNTILAVLLIVIAVCLAYLAMGSDTSWAAADIKEVQEIRTILYAGWVNEGVDAAYKCERDEKACKCDISKRKTQWLGEDWVKDIRMKCALAGVHMGYNTCKEHNMTLGQCQANVDVWVEHHTEKMNGS